MRGGIYTIAFVLSSGFLFKSYGKNGILFAIAGVFALVSGMFTANQILEFLNGSSAGASLDLSHYIIPLASSSALVGLYLLVFANKFSDEMEQPVRTTALCMIAVGLFIFYTALFAGHNVFPPL